MLPRSKSNNVNLWANVLFIENKKKSYTKRFDILLKVLIKLFAITPSRACCEKQSLKSDKTSMTQYATYARSEMINVFS